MRRKRNKNKIYSAVIYKTSSNINAPYVQRSSLCMNASQNKRSIQNMRGASETVLRIRTIFNRIRLLKTSGSGS
jgi:hypothetical protein